MIMDTRPTLIILFSKAVHLFGNDIPEHFLFLHNYIPIQRYMAVTLQTHDTSYVYKDGG